MPTLLVVDDDEAMRATLETVFSRLGYAVRTAESGAMALAIFDDGEFGAAIVDVQMPGMNGIEVCHELCGRAQAKGRDLPVWLMTGAFSRDIEALGLQAGAVAVLSKPFDFPALVAELKRRSGAA